MLLYSVPVFVTVSILPKYPSSSPKCNFISIVTEMKTTEIIAPPYFVSRILQHKSVKLRNNCSTFC